MRSIFLVDRIRGTYARTTAPVGTQLPLELTTGPYRYLYSVWKYFFSASQKIFFSKKVTSPPTCIIASGRRRRAPAELEQKWVIFF
jgi:hypothetical protein